MTHSPSESETRFGWKPGLFGWFDKAVRRGVRAGIEKGIADASAPGGVIERTVWECMDRQLPRDRRLSRLGFTWALALRFRAAGSSFAEAGTLANQTLASFLGDENIPFGHRDYEWTRAAAEEIAEEFELQYWEVA